MTRSLCNYHAQIKVDGGEALGYYAYCIDGGDSREESLDMARYVGCASFHCCDYFEVADNTVYLIEFTTSFGEQAIRETNKQMANLLSLAEKISQNESAFFKDAQRLLRHASIGENIITESKLKIYGTLFILCRFAQGCKSMKKFIYGKKCKFLLVSKDGRKNNLRAMDTGRAKIEKTLRNAMPGIITGASIITYKSTDDLEQQLSKLSIFSRQKKHDTE